MSTTRTSTTRRTPRFNISPSAQERKELGITTGMTLRILRNLHEVIDRHAAEWLAENS